MVQSSQKVEKPRFIEPFLAILGSALCLIISLWVGQLISRQQPLWLLPGLYLVELVALSLVVVIVSFRDAPYGAAAIWAVVGGYLAFVILGSFSIGLLYFPVMLTFLPVAILSDIRKKGKIARHLGICLLAAAIQGALMLLIIQMF